MYFFLGSTIILVCLLIVNTLIAVLASAIWKVVSGAASHLSAANRAQIIFSLRVLPVVAALVFVLAFVGPAYILLEPDNSGEVVSGKLALIALVSLVGVFFALYRVVKASIATRRLKREWLQNAIKVNIEGVDLAVFRISSAFPVIAVIGVWRPKVFIAEQVLASLGHDELHAALAHEKCHIEAMDNFKRTVLRVCRDLLILPLGTALDRAWAETIESAADEKAAASGPEKALDLASALVKIARIVPVDNRDGRHASPLAIDRPQLDLTARVTRLVEFTEPNTPTRRPEFGYWSSLSWICSTALVLMFVAYFNSGHLLLTTHQAIEHLVDFLE